MHEYLAEHPRVSSPVTKEVHYFDHNHHRGGDWYRAHFPVPRRNEISGESTPYYLFHPLAPARVARDLPGIKPIAILRNPIDRAFSHHNHELALGYEHLPFEEAIARESERLAGEEERLLADSRYRSFAHQHYSYLSRSKYVEQLERWFGHLNREQFLILSAEDLFESPREALAKAQRFLGLELDFPIDLSPRNARTYAPVNADVRARLLSEFEPSNRRLYELVGRDFGWN